MKTESSGYWLSLSVTLGASCSVLLSAHCGSDDDSSIAVPADGGAVDSRSSSGSSGISDGGLADVADAKSISPVCEEFRTRGEEKGCSDAKTVNACAIVMGCSTIQQDVMRGTYRCALDAPDFCKDPLEKCMVAAATERAREGAAASYQATCIAHHQKCVDAGTGYDIELCGPPYPDNAIVVLATDETLQEMAKCFDGACDKPSSCVANALKCR